MLESEKERLETDEETALKSIYLNPRQHGSLLRIIIFSSHHRASSSSPIASLLALLSVRCADLEENLGDVLMILPDAEVTMVDLWGSVTSELCH